MTEAFLQYVWQHKLLDKGLLSTEGEPVCVLRPGELNRDAGPDFFGAHVSIGGVEWVGNVEVHVRTSDWNAHRHSADKRYNNIILHVVYEHDCEIEQEDGKRPVTLELKPFVNPSLVSAYQELLAPESEEPIPCGKRVGEVPAFAMDAWLDRMAVERIEAKSAAVRRLLDESHGSWEQTCYWLMAHYFGGKVNALPFEMMAKATDQRLLARWRDNPQRIEALLMGQAGLLEGYFEDDFPRQLQTDYNALRTGASLTPVSGYLWKFYRMRPSAFPTLRISQFAALVSQSKNLFATLLGITDAKEMERLFDQPASPYWDSHYMFDRPAEKSAPKRLGRMQSDLLIINAWVPLLFVYGITHGQQQYKDQAFGLLEQLAPEKNQIIRLWEGAGVSPRNAAQSQALLQLKTDYCARRRCLECSMGYHIMKQR